MSPSQYDILSFLKAARALNNEQPYQPAVPPPIVHALRRSMRSGASGL